jgi:hypothetical protein
LTPPESFRLYNVEEKDMKAEWNGEGTIQVERSGLKIEKTYPKFFDFVIWKETLKLKLELSGAVPHRPHQQKKQTMRNGTLQVVFKFLQQEEKNKEQSNL